MEQKEDPSALDVGIQIFGEVTKASRVPLTPREMAASDREQLEIELNYRKPRHDRRFFKTHPPGYNVMVGMGAFFALTGFLVGGVLTMAVLGPGGLSGPLALLAGLVTGGFAGGTAPTAIWRGIGPGLRSVLRIPGYLGAGPIVIMMMLFFSLLVQGIKGVVELSPKATPSPRTTPSAVVTPSPKAPPPLSGEDWQVLRGPDNKVLILSLPEARARCAALGEGWRLPTRYDGTSIGKQVKHPEYLGCRFQLDEPSSGLIGYFEYKPRSGWSLHGTIEPETCAVLCLYRPAKKKKS